MIIFFSPGISIHIHWRAFTLGLPRSRSENCLIKNKKNFGTSVLKGVSYKGQDLSYAELYSTEYCKMGPTHLPSFKPTTVQLRIHNGSLHTNASFRSPLQQNRHLELATYVFKNSVTIRKALFQNSTQSM